MVASSRTSVTCMISALADGLGKMILPTRKGGRHWALKWSHDQLLVMCITAEKDVQRMQPSSPSATHMHTMAVPAHIRAHFLLSNLRYISSNGVITSIADERECKIHMRTDASA